MANIIKYGFISVLLLCGIPPFIWHHEEIKKTHTSQDAKQDAEHTEGWYIDAFASGTWEYLWAVPLTKRTAAVCLAAVKADPQDERDTLKNIPSEIWDKGLLVSVIETQSSGLITTTVWVPVKGDGLCVVPARLWDKQLAREAVARRASALRAIYYSRRGLCTPELYEFALREHRGDALQYIPESSQTPEMCATWVSKYPQLLQYVAWEFRTLELCHVALENSNDAWEFVPKKYLLQSLLEKTR